MRDGHGIWILAGELAELAGVSPRAARRAAGGGRWRGAHLESRRDRDGWWVRVDSLPGDLQEKWRALHGLSALSEPETVRAELSRSTNIRPADRPLWHWRQQIIAPVLETPPRSKERGAAFSKAARDHGLSCPTVRRWLADYGQGGLGALRRKERARASYHKCLIGRRWDGLSIDAETRREIHSKLLRYVRSLWAADVPGAKQVVRAATVRLMDLTRAAACELPERELRKACTVTRHFVEKERRYKIIAVHDRDAKKFADSYIPRVKRSRAGLKPMDIVVGDVHPIDVLLRRDDGSLATARAVCWHDWATNRVHMTLVLPEKGTGIRQEHVIAAFIDMVHEWGMPSVLYLDNGGEYGWTGFIEDAMRLTSMTVNTLPAEFASLVRSERESMVVRARRYNAPAKAPAEGTYAVLETGVFRMLPGWIGGDRMRQKTQNVGQAPKPFPGTFDEFKGAVAIALADFHATEQSGQLAGKSPNEVYAEFIAAGWRPVTVDRGVLEAAFSEEMTRKVRQSVITIDGDQYDHDDLGVFNGRTIAIRRPKIGDGSRVTATLDGRIVVLQRRPSFAVLDAEGARFQGERAGALRRRLRELRRDTDPIDTIAVMRANVAAAPPAPALPKPAGVLRLAEDIHAAAAALAAAPAPAPAPQLNAAAALWLTYGRRRACATAGGGGPPAEDPAAPTAGQSLTKGDDL